MFIVIDLIRKKILTLLMKPEKLKNCINIFQNSLMLHLYLWEYKYISIVSWYRTCIVILVIFNNHVSSLIGLLSKL